MGAQILIVDDEPIIHTLMQHAFTDRPDWTVTCVDSAERALEELGSGSYDLVVVDKNLGSGMSGVELVDRIRERDRMVGICMITGYGSVENAVEMLHLRADGYLEKPFDDIKEVGKKFEVIIRKSLNRRTGEISEIRRLDEPSAAHEIPTVVKEVEERRMVLVVSTEAGEIEWIAGALKEISIVDIQKSYEAALKYVKESPPNLIIVDTRVEATKVEEFITQVLLEMKEVDLVVMSPFLSMAAIKRFIDLGIWAILDLPLVKDQFDIRVVQTLQYTW